MMEMQAAVAPVTGFRGEHGLISADDVEARLIEARIVFNRIEAKGGAWATDGPWYLSRRRGATEATDAVVGALELGENIERVLHDPRPDREMIRRCEEAAAWMGLIPSDADRRLVNDVIGDLATVRGVVNWSRILKRMGLLRGKSGLERRYKRALVCLANRLNG